MKACYLAGPMRGIEAFNFPAFREAAARLRAQGWTVLSPAEADEAVGFDASKNSLDGFDMKAALLRDVTMLAAADAIALLPGWRRSQGATLEDGIARYLGKDRYEYVDGALHALPGSVLREASALVHGDRGQDYGHPCEDFGRTARLWSVLFGTDVTAHQVALAMVLVKVSRLVNDPTKRDSIVDVAGYAETLAMLGEAPDAP